MKKHLILLYISSFILGALSMWVIDKRLHPATNCQIIHAQPVCLRDTIMLHNFFVEVDGTKIDACMKPTGDDCVDYLAPGESMSVRLNRMK